jgi:hypothetical protein
MDTIAPVGSEAQCLVQQTQRDTAQAFLDSKNCFATQQAKFEDYQQRCSNPVQKWTDIRNTLQTKLDAQKAIFDNLVDATNISQNATGPIDAYVQELDSQFNTLKEENYTLQQGIRAGRRRFLDDDPQRKVANVLGLQTSDDKVLLAFWICFVVGLIAVYSVVLYMYGDALNLQTGQQKVGVFVVMILLSVGTAYYFIYKYA